MRKRASRASEPRHQRGARGPREVSWRFIAAALVFGAVAAGVAFYTWTRQASPLPSRRRDNILLVTIDTARADRFGMYGYAAARTRHLDRLAAEGVRFDRAFSAAPITLPAHASMFTGLYPFEHGVRNNGNFYLADTFETLATALKKQGYRTAAFVSAFVLDRRYGLARGFDVYDDRMQGAQAQVISLEAERRGDRTELALAAWLEQNAGAGGTPFFAWLHLYDPHEPYHAPPPFGPAFANSPYDGEIAFTDAIVASLFDKLGELGVRDHTIIALIGDHGESLGDHGEETHSMFVYDAAIRIPFVLWRPGRIPAGTIVAEPVRGIDLAPTLLDLAGAPALAAPHARSLVPLIDGARGPETPPVYAETYLPQFYLNWSPLRTLRDDRWKFIDAPAPELYDMSADPAEQHNLYASQRQTGEAMRGALARLTGGSPGAMAAGTVDRDTAEKLAALGYIGAGAAPTPTPDASPRRDPKDVIALFNRLRRANSAVRDRRFAEALPILHDVLKDDPRNAFAQLVLGSAYMGMEQYRQAIDQYRKYVALVPTSAYAHQWMAICYVRLGQQDDALREADAALALDPRYADARVLRGGIFASRGRYDDALRELRAAVASDPAKAMVRLDLAKVLDEAGRRDEAAHEYLAILAQQPNDAAALTGLGALRAREGRLADAAGLLRRALEIDPSNETTRFDLAGVLEQEGRTAEAAAEYRTLTTGPGVSEKTRQAARARLTGLDRSR